MGLAHPAPGLMRRAEFHPRCRSRRLIDEAHPPTTCTRCCVRCRHSGNRQPTMWLAPMAAAAMQTRRSRQPGAAEPSQPQAQRPRQAVNKATKAIVDLQKR